MFWNALKKCCEMQCSRLLRSTINTVFRIYTTGYTQQDMSFYDVPHFVLSYVFTFLVPWWDVR